MASDENPGIRDRLVRTVLAAVLTVVAVRWFQRGKRLRGALAGVGALALGVDATRESGGPTVEYGEATVHESADMTGADDAETADEGTELYCAICGEPIRLGQMRGPNEHDEIVHDACE